MTELLPKIDAMAKDGPTIIQERLTDMQKTSADFFAAGDYESALKAAALAQNMIDAVAMFNPKGAAVAALQKNQDASVAKLKTALKKYYTSDFHAANAGKVVFSKVPLVPDGKEASKVQASFKDGDNIWAIAYLNSRLKDLNPDPELFMILYFVDGKAMNGMMAAGNVVPAKLDDTTFAFPVMAGPKDSEMLFPAQFIQRIAAEYGTGSHTVKIQFTDFARASDQKIVAEGSFALDIADPAALKSRAEEHRKAAVARARMPAPVITSASVEADMKALMPQNFNEPIETLRATIGEGSWNVVKDEYDQPQYRYIRGFVAFKVKKTGKVYYRGIAIMQTYEGAGTYSKKSSIYNATEPYDLYEMDPANVNK